MRINEATLLEALNEWFSRHTVSETNTKIVRIVSVSNRRPYRFILELLSPGADAPSTSNPYETEIER